MPHSSKKYKKQPGSKSSALAAKWYVVIVIVATLVVLSGLYFAYPPFSAGFDTMLGTSPKRSPTNLVVGNSTSLNTGNSTTFTGNPTSCSGCLYALIDTSQGTIEIELFQSLTPTAVNNFVSLADSGFYNNLVWHRIVSGFVIQTGDPNTRNAVNNGNWGEGGSNTSVPLDVVPSLSNDVGYVAYAHTSSTTTASSQFYINLADNTNLNGQYTVFGKVIKGMSVVNAIAALSVNSQQQPVNPQQAMMISVSIQNSP